MNSFSEWRKKAGLFSEMQEQDIDWDRMKVVFGQERQMVKPQLIHDFKASALNDNSIKKYLELYSGNRDELAKDLIMAVLKIVFGQESGGGLAVSGKELGNQQQQPAPQQHPQPGM